MELRNVDDAQRGRWPQRAARRSDERYEQIYETAARLFYEKGYANTSLQDIASAVGLQKGSLYHYITSKEDLLHGITEYAHEFFARLTEAADESGVTVMAEIERRLRLHAEFTARHFHITAVFYNERAALSPDRQERVLRTRDAYEGRLRQLVRDGQAAGEIAADLDPRMAVFGILGMVNWITHWYRPGGPLGPEQIGDIFSTMGVRALLPGPPDRDR